MFDWWVACTRNEGCFYFVLFPVADDCLPQWADTVELSRWFQNQQVGKSDAEHNQGIDKVGYQLLKLVINDIGSFLSLTALLLNSNISFLEKFLSK